MVNKLETKSDDGSPFTLSLPIRRRSGFGWIALLVGLTLCVEGALFGQALSKVSSARASQMRVQDPTTFSLKGLRLYMTPQEALAILRALGETSVYSQPCVNERVADLKAGRSPAYNGSCIFRIQMGPDVSKLRVILDFAEDLPAHAGTMRLWNINVTQGGFATEADRVSAITAVEEKYGPPSSATHNLALYCGGTNNRAQCQRENFITGTGTVFDEPRLFAADAYPLNLPPSGLYAHTSEFFTELTVDLYDGAFRFRAAREEKRLINETRTVQKPVL